MFQPSRVMSLLVATAALSLQAQAPVITGITPDNLIVQPERVFVYSHLTGKNIWPSGPNDPNRWHLYVRQVGGPWTDTDLRMDSHTEADIGFHILSEPYLMKPGLLEFKVSLDGVESNSFPVQVRKVPPRLELVSPQEIRMDASLDPAIFNIFYRLHYWIDPIQVVINGKGYDYLSRPWAAEEAKSPWPQELRKPGIYTVQLRNPMGISEAKTLEILGAPILTTATPPVIHPSDWSPKATTGTPSAAAPLPAGTAPAASASAVHTPVSSGASAARAALATFELKVAYQGTAPTSLSWRTDRISWQDVYVRGAIKGSEVRVPLPVSDLSQATWVEVRTSNKVGESILRVPVTPDPVILHPNPPGAAGATLRTPPTEPPLVVQNLPKLPPAVIQRATNLKAKLQPQLRAWVEDQARRLRGTSALDVEAVRAAVRSRLALPPGPGIAPTAAAGPRAPARTAPTAAATSVAQIPADASVEAAMFILMQMMAADAEQDMQDMLADMNKTRDRKAKLRDLQQELAKEQAGSKPATSPCGSPLCGTILERYRALTAQLPAKARRNPRSIGTYGDLVAFEADLKATLDSLSELSEQDSLRMQMQLERMQKIQTAASSQEKKFSDTAGSILGNFK